MKCELTLAALERLIGGETEIEVCLRQQIVETFTKKYIKSIIHDQCFSALSNQWKDELKSCINEKLIELKDKFTLNEDGLYQLKWEIVSTVDKIFEEMFKQRINEQLDRYQRYYIDLIDKKIKSTIDEEINRKILQRVQTAFDSVYNEVVKKVNGQKD